MERMTSDDTRVFLDQMWARYAYLADERVATMEAFLNAARDGSQTEEMRAVAQSAAHNLVGALGSYHRPGSAEAAQAERLLIDGGPTTELEQLVGRLRQLIT